MGFYIRKSLSFGPLRFNLSGSGVGVSAGIKGFRIGTGPRGNYIHAGVGGLYYRQTLGGHTSSQRAPRYGAPMPAPPVPESTTTEQMQEIESAAASSMVDQSAAGLLSELNSKRALFRFWPVSLVPLLPTLLLSIAQPHWGWIVLDILLAALTGFCVWWDGQRKTTVLFYDLQLPVLPAFESLHNAFELLARCGGMWHVDAQAAVLDRKYHAGASSSIRRSRIALQVKNPPYVKTNIPVMCLPAGRQRLYFFPDRILVHDAGGIGAVSYTGLKLSQSFTRFVEQEGVPPDSQIVGRTWRYVNKDGGPDRRFRDNLEIPIARYTELHFRSDTGLNELLMFSNHTNVSVFVAALEAFRACLPSPGSADFQMAATTDIESYPAQSDPEAAEPLVPLMNHGPEPITGAVAIAPPTETKRFYYFGQGVQGPFSAEELALLAQQGTISSDTQVCSVDNQQWTSYQEFLTN